MALSISKDDNILITSPLGWTIKATVISASNYGNRFPEDPPCWYIELLDSNGHFRYWKQDSDGGTVVNLSLLMEDK